MNRKAAVAAGCALLGAALPAVAAVYGWSWFLDGPQLPGCIASGFLAGAWLPRRTAAAVVLLVTAGCTLGNQLDSDTYHWLDDLVFFLVMTGGPAAAGATVTTRARQVRWLRELSTELEERRGLEVEAARLEEQIRIEQRVHARLAERIGGILVRAEGAQRAMERVSDDDAALAAIEAEARGVLDQLRSALGSLAPGEEAHEADAHAASPRPVRPSLLDVALVTVIGLGLAIETNVVEHARGPVWANVLVAGAAVAPLLLRRTHPMVAAIASCGVGIAAGPWLTPVPSTVTGVALAALIFYSIGAWGRRWWWVLGTLVTAAAMAAMETTSGLASDADEGDAGWIGLLFSLGAVALGRLAAGWQERVTRIEDAVAELERRSDAEVRLAVARERQAVASSLHDSVAHAMTVVCLQAGASQRAGPSGLDALTTIVDTAASSLAELRDGLDAIESTRQPLGSSRLAALGRHMGVDLEVRASPSGPSGAATVLAFRVVREAVVNVARHAPGARTVVTVDQADEAVRVEVTDDGGAAHGFAHGTGTGLTGLAAEVRAAGGEMTWGPHAGGFRVTADVPLTTRTLETTP